MENDEEPNQKYVKGNPLLHVNPSSRLLIDEEMRGRLAEIERLILLNSQGALRALLITWILLALILWRVW